MIREIEQIYRVWWVIENAPIVPEREQKLKHIARLRSGVYSTKIEWNRISYDDAEKFLRWEDIVARPRDQQELSNYMDVLDYIEHQEWSWMITEDHIFAIHQLTTKNILDEWYHYKWRNIANAVYNEWWGIVYLPPDRKEVPKLMKELLEYVNTHTETSVLIRAALLHHRFVVVHPFIDGNGRTARALTQLFLYQHWFNTKKYFSLEEYYDSDLANYYQAIFIGNDYYTATEQGAQSTKFVEYFLAGLAHELNYLKKTIASIGQDRQREEMLQSAGLTNRQIHIATTVKEQWVITAAELLKIYSVSIATIKRDLSVLVAAGLIVADWSTKLRRYRVV
jgi:Fic family protein